MFADTQEHNEYEANYLDAPGFSFKQRLSLEKSVMGYYFYDHPTDEYKADLKHINATLPSGIGFRNNKDVRVLALISELRYRATKSGGQIATVIVEDGSQSLNAVVFTKALSSVSDKLLIDEVVVISGKINKDFRDQWQVVVEKIESIDDVKMSYAKGFEVLLSEKHQTYFNQLTDVFNQHKGECPVKISYQTKSLRGSIPLSKDVRVMPNQELVDAVNGLVKDQVSKIHYH